MNVLNSKYYSRTKFFMELIGLWPYQTSTRRWISLTLYCALISSVTIPGVLYLVLKNPTFEEFGLTAILVMMVINSQLKYFVSFSSMSQLRILLSQIKKDWKNITDIEELDILKNYAKESRFISSSYIIYVLGGTFLNSVSPLVLSLTEKLFPLKNGSYPLFVMIPLEYLFVEQLDHLTLANLHLFLACMCAVSVFAGVDTIYVCTVQHVAALFTIDCHRLEKMFEFDNCKKNMKKLKESVELYNQCIRCCQLLEDCFSNCLFLTLILCPFSIGASGYLLFNSRDIYYASKFMALLIGLIVYSFYINWVGQKIIDSSEKVLSSAYNSNWYDMPQKMQKSVVIIMCRSLKPQELTVGKMFILSMYSFGKLMRACTSIFTILAVVEQNFD